MTAGPEKAVQDFLNAVVSQNWAQAQSLASGKTLFTLKQRERQGVKAQPAQITDVSVHCRAVSSEWAVVDAVVELELFNGDTDVTWYQLEMVKQNNDWKIYRAELAGPEIAGKSKDAPTTDVVAAKDVFEQYLSALATNEWDKAAKYLAGPARRAHEIGEPFFGRAPIIEKVEGVILKPVWYNGRLLVCSATYRINGQDACVLATFIHTERGWKMVQVASTTPG